VWSPLTDFDCQTQCFEDAQKSVEPARRLPALDLMNDARGDARCQRELVLTQPERVARLTDAAADLGSPGWISMHDRAFYR
jgi:hypothetical protein